MIALYYREHGMDISAVAADDGRWNAVGRVRPARPFDAKAHVETVTCYKATAQLAQVDAQIWARRWVDLHLPEDA
jgi:hypothetical protein